jgi:predicted S18 family serine protease
MKKLLMVTTGAILLALPASAGNLHPMRLSTKVEDFIVAAERAAKQGKYDDAIINYRTAKTSAITECDIEAAIAGEKASLIAKMQLNKPSVSNSSEAQAKAAMAYRKIMEEEHSNMRSRCAL